MRFNSGFKGLNLNIQFLPQWQQTLPSIKINWHKLKEIIVLYFQNHTRHTHALCGVMKCGAHKTIRMELQGITSGFPYTTRNAE